MLRNKNNKKHGNYLVLQYIKKNTIMLVETSLIFTKVTYFNPVHKY